MIFRFPVVYLLIIAVFRSTFWFSKDFVEAFSHEELLKGSTYSLHSVAVDHSYFGHIQRDEYLFAIFETEFFGEISFTRENDVNQDPFDDLSYYPENLDGSEYGATRLLCNYSSQILRFDSNPPTKSVVKFSDIFENNSSDHELSKIQKTFWKKLLTLNTNLLLPKKDASLLFPYKLLLCEPKESHFKFESVLLIKAEIFFLPQEPPLLFEFVKDYDKVLGNCEIHFLDYNEQVLKPPGSYYVTTSTGSKVSIKGNSLKVSQSSDKLLSNCDSEKIIKSNRKTYLEISKNFEELVERSEEPENPISAIQEKEKTKGKESLEIYQRLMGPLDGVVKGVISGLADGIIDSLAEPLGGSMTKDLSSTLGVAFSSSAADQLIQKVPPLVKKGLEGMLPALVVALIAELEEAIPRDMTQHIAGAISKDVNKRLTKSVGKTVETKVLESAGSDVPSENALGMLVPVIHALSRQLPHAIVPSLIGTITHSAAQDYVCMVCYKKNEFCDQCHYSSVKLVYGMYYASYYTNWYSDYYADYYYEYFRSIMDPEHYPDKTPRFPVDDGVLPNARPPHDKIPVTFVK